MRVLSFVIGSISFMIYQYAEKYRRDDLVNTLEELNEDYGLPRIKEWDFIIVGAGTSGCLMAARLSESYSVLLLERGGPAVPSTYNVDAYFFNTYRYSPYINDLYPAYSVPGRPEISYAGRMIGGSGAHNADIYNRGNPKDYDIHWVNQTGDASFSYDEMLHDYKNFERFIGVLIDEKERTKYFGWNGDLVVNTDIPKYGPLWFEAGSELGFPILDPNTRQAQSFTPMQKTERNGLRDNSCTSYLQRTAINRTTLTVITYSTVETVLVNNGEKKAYGVTYTRHGIPQISHARKEVILSAGTLGTPVILLKSGIGPANILTEARIPVICNLPGVGARMQDHSAFLLNFTVSNRELMHRYFPYMYPQRGVEQEFINFQQPEKGRSLFAHSDMTQAYIVSSRARANGQGDWPDIQLVTIVEPQEDPDPINILILTFLSRPESVGRLLINTTALGLGEDATRIVTVDFQYLSHPSDIPVLIEGIRWVLRIVRETTPFQALGLNLVTPVPEPCRPLQFDTDEYWTCFMFNLPAAGEHPCGTCRMGRDTEVMTVVDNKFRVRGLRNLRIVDASVMPYLTNSNINAPLLALTEKAARTIAADHKTR